MYTGSHKMKTPGQSINRLLFFRDIHDMVLGSGEMVVVSEDVRNVDG
jgi:hypothetical protein